MLRQHAPRVASCMPCAHTCRSSTAAPQAVCAISLRAAGTAASGAACSSSRGAAWAPCPAGSATAGGMATMGGRPRGGRTGLSVGGWGLPPAAGARSSDGSIRPGMPPGAAVCRTASAEAGRPSRAAGLSGLPSSTAPPARGEPSRPPGEGRQADSAAGDPARKWARAAAWRGVSARGVNLQAGGQAQAVEGVAGSGSAPLPPHLTAATMPPPGPALHSQAATGLLCYWWEQASGTGNQALLTPESLPPQHA